MATIVYDGYCNLCIRSVRFLQRHARPGALEFVANPAADQRTVVVVDGGVEYRKSDASLQALTYLRPPWPALRVLRLVPRPVRDAVYDWVARNRYRWFGRSEYCDIATSQARSASAAAGSLKARSGAKSASA
jgi:predicted DCC family thiol-disulfide oxidoreductase YuxK